jgi:hypothetical protein
VDQHLWERLNEILEFVRNDLTLLHFETREEALNKKYRKSIDPNDLRADSMFVARYRETDDRENLLDFHRQALEALEDVEISVEKREMNAKFIDQWSRLLSCHGFVTAAIVARGDDMQSKRAGAGGRAATNLDAQRQWFSHYYLREEPNYSTRAQTEEAIERLVNRIVDGEISVPGFEVGWFEAMLNLDVPADDPRYSTLTNSFRDGKLFRKEMKRLRALPSAGLPPLDLNLHHP